MSVFILLALSGLSVCLGWSLLAFVFCFFALIMIDAEKFTPEHDLATQELLCSLRFPKLEERRIQRDKERALAEAKEKEDAELAKSQEIERQIREIRKFEEYCLK